MFELYFEREINGDQLNDDCIGSFWKLADAKEAMTSSFLHHTGQVKGRRKIDDLQAEIKGKNWRARYYIIKVDEESGG